MAVVRPSLQPCGTQTHPPLKEAILGQKYEAKVGSPSSIRRIQEIYFPSQNIILNSEGSAFFAYEPRNKETKGKHLIANPLTFILVSPEIVKEVTALAVLQSQMNAPIATNVELQLSNLTEKVKKVTKHFWA